MVDMRYTIKDLDLLDFIQQTVYGKLKPYFLLSLILNPITMPRKKNGGNTPKRTTSKKVASQSFPIVEKNGKLYVSQEATEVNFRTSKSDQNILQDLFGVKLLRNDANKGFCFLDGVNRPVIPSHVTKMAESVSRIGITRPVVVGYFEYQGRKDHYIIDGQNLYHALLRLGYHIPYKVIDIENEEDMVEKIALLNTSSKTWSLMDYVTAWSYIRPHYKKLSHFFNVYDLDLSSIASVMYGYLGTSNANITKVIKEGNFEIKDLDKSIRILDCTTDVLNIVPRLDRNANRSFVSAYTGFIGTNYDTYDHARFCKYLKRNAEKLQLVNADKDVITEFFNKAL